MNKLKKSLALIATLAIASTALVACGGSDSKPADTTAATTKASTTAASGEATDAPTTTEAQKEEAKIEMPDTGDQLTILCWTGDDIEKMIENFESKNPDAKGKIKYQNVGKNGGDAREKYANYFAGGSDADLFVLEADWILEYINQDDYTAPLSKIGFTADDFKGCYPYTVSIGTNNAGVLKAASWQATPGAYAYRADLAEQYLGVKTPAEMQEKVKDWKTFTETAKAVKEASKGKTAMTATLGGLWQVYQYNHGTAWAKDGVADLNDQYYKDFAELAKTYYTEGYVTKTSQWAEDGSWYAIGQDDSTLGYFFCTWCFGKGSMLSNAEGGEGGKTYGKYALCEGPSTWAWGGSWLALNPKCDNGTLAHDFVKYFTVDEASMEDYALFKGEFVNNPNVMKKIVDDKKNSNPLFKDGQDQFAVLYPSASKIDMSGKISEFDSQIKNAYNEAVMNYAQGKTASVDEMMEAFKKKAAQIEGLTLK